MHTPAFAQKLAWSFTPTSSTAHSNAYSSTFPDGAGGAVIVTDFRNGSGNNVESRLAWISKTGKVKYDGPILEAIDSTEFLIVSATPSCVIYRIDNGVRKITMKGSVAVMNDSYLPGKQVLYINPYGTTPLGFFTLSESTNPTVVSFYKK